MHGLFGSDAEHVTGSPVDETEIHGESNNPGPQTADPSEARAPTILRSPVRPSAGDVEKHNATHLPYRSLCPICVKASGNEDPHRRKKKETKVSENSGVAKISLDYQELKSRPAKRLLQSEAPAQMLRYREAPVNRLMYRSSCAERRLLRRSCAERLLCKSSCK